MLESESKDPSSADAQDDSDAGKELAVTNINALVNAYTERPDLLIDALEKHDPGFVQTMNEDARDKANRFHESKFKFGERQAYASMGIGIATPVAIFGAIFYLIYLGKLTFWLLVGFLLFFAVTQGGLSGFHKIIDAISRLMGRSPADKKIE